MKMSHIGRTEEPSASYSLGLEHCVEFNTPNTTKDMSAGPPRAAGMIRGLKTHSVRTG